MKNEKNDNKKKNSNTNNIKEIKGGVCAAKGFFANGIYSGIKKKKTSKDLAIIYSESLCAAAAVYTQNKVCGANIIVSKENLKNGKAKAIYAIREMQILAIKTELKKQKQCAKAWLNI